MKITVPDIVTPQSTTRNHPFVVTIPVNISSRTPVITRSPADDGVFFRPAQQIKQERCPPDATGTAGSPSCFRYLIPVYADYQSSANASVRISSTLTGRNDWKILGPGFNEFETWFVLDITGENHGWEQAEGSLLSGIGSYDTP